MTSFRASLALAYLVCLYLVALAVMGFWNRYTVPIWETTLSNSRTGYDVIGGINVLLGLAVAFGLMRRYEWARVSCVMLSAVVVFSKIGMPLITPYITQVPLVEVINATNIVEAFVATFVAFVTIVGLTRPTFRTAYSGRNA